MAEDSKIQWTTHTFNPWSGCSKVHAGCTHCYAEVNYSVKMRGVKWGPNGTRVVAADATWKEPLKWNRLAMQAMLDHESETNLGKDLGPYERPRVFCASLADVFEDWQGPMLDHHGEKLEEDGDAYPRNTVSMNDVRARLFALIDATPNLDWMLLTKRPENVRRMWPVELDNKGFTPVKRRRDNVWLGTSISDQGTFDKWTPELLKLRDLSPVLFLSAEPLVGPVDMLYPSSMFPDGPRRCCDGRECGCRGMPVDPWMLWGIDLVIVGGESGHGARPCNVEWIRSIVKQCAEANVACFVKQLGSVSEFNEADDGDSWPDGVYFDGPEDNEPDAPAVAILKDKKGGDMAEWPADIRVRQMPGVSV